MSLLRDQKKLQRRHYEQTSGQTDKDPEARVFKPRTSGHSMLLEIDRQVEADMATYKGLPIEEKVEIKKALVKKYQPHVQTAIEGKPQADSLLINAFIVWLFDIGDMEGFLSFIDLAIARKLKQTIIANKDYLLLKLYWILDWTGQQRELGASFEPYFTQTFQSIKDWKLPKKIKEGYWYFMFYSLLAQNKLEEAEKVGDVAVGHGAEIKTNLGTLKKVLEGKVEKTWDPEGWKFV